jgi:uncharacterized protein YndB with AHSA1/START domain
MIDTSSLAARGTEMRSVVCEAVVDAQPDEVWAAWASAEGIAAWWGPPATRIDLRVGGPFELLFAMDQPAGRQGSEGCCYLSYVPGEMVSFTWNAPPHLALRETNTWVVVTFERLNGVRTGVRLVHTGFLDGPDWDDYMSYFADAWGSVLGLLTEHWRTP